ncbi:MAG TPA: SDR family NAD(P)-dependent oxidoreductase [Stellaceae bacterium]|nr:SDR family NAD(P)-dependent oxidoreductase [Stellaceae bacterium]
MPVNSQNMPPQNMQPRTIAITGGSNGLGAALARRYAAPGVTLGLIGRNAGRLEAVAAECRAKGANVACGIIDVTDAAGLADWLKRFDAAHPIDLLVANAGVSAGIVGNDVAEGRDTVAKVIETNLIGAINAVEPLLPAFEARRRGQIALVASIAGLRGLPYSPGYCASKAGLRSYGEALRPLLKPLGIHVGVICPGFFESDMSRRFGGSKPMMVTAERAAEIIAKGLAAGRGRIDFPLIMAWALKLADLLPAWLGDRMVSGYKGEVEEAEKS